MRLAGGEWQSSGVGVVFEPENIARLIEEFAWGWSIDRKRKQGSLSKQA
jgi:hypothetical protein